MRSPADGKDSFREQLDAARALLPKEHRPSFIGEHFAKAIPRTSRTYEPRKYTDTEFAALIVQRLKDAGCPARHAEVHADVDDKVDRIMRHEIAVILGVRGVGKTQVAVEVLRRVAFNHELARESGRPVVRLMYARAWDLFHRLKGSYQKDGLLAAMREVLAPAWLVIDEMHAVQATEWERHALENLIDKRYGERKRTLMVANQTKAQFVELVGESVASRIVETGGAVDASQWQNRRAKQNGTS